MAVEGTPITGSSDVSLDFEDLYLAVGEYLFATRNLSGDQTTEAKRIVNDAYMEFLHEHDWNFMQPYTTLSVTASDETTDLPSTYLELLSPFSFDPDEHSGRNLDERSPQVIRRLKAANQNSTGELVAFAVIPKTFVPATGQRFTVLWYPVPASDRTLYYRFRAAATMMSSDAEFPMGGQMHAQTIRLKCLQIAEAGTKGLVKGHFWQLYYGTQNDPGALRRSMVRDAGTRPRNLGYNADRSEAQAVPGHRFTTMPIP